MWALGTTAGGASGYLRIDSGTTIFVQNLSGSSWTISNGGFLLSGSWSSQAEALEALRRLVDGVDPAGY